MERKPLSADWMGLGTYQPTRRKQCSRSSPLLSSRSVSQRALLWLRHPAPAIPATRSIPDRAIPQQLRMTRQPKIPAPTARPISTQQDRRRPRTRRAPLLPRLALRAPTPTGSPRTANRRTETLQEGRRCRPFFIGTCCPLAGSVHGSRLLDFLLEQWPRSKPAERSAGFVFDFRVRGESTFARGHAPTCRGVFQVVIAFSIIPAVWPPSSCFSPQLGIGQTSDGVNRHPQGPEIFELTAYRDPQRNGSGSVANRESALYL
jgi:hypothetical protein